MSDPKRWRETEGEAMRSFLARLAGVEPTPEMRESVWQKVTAGLPPDASSGSGDPTSGDMTPSAPTNVAGTAVSSGAAKVIGVSASLVVAGAIIVAAFIPPASPTSPSSTLASSAIGTSAPSPPPASEVLPIETPSSAGSEPSAAPSMGTSRMRPAAVRRPSRAVDDAPSTSASAVPAAPSVVAPAAERTDALRAESEGIRKARRLLRNNDAAGALAELDRLQRLYPMGALQEEREVLAIEALAASDPAAARRRADRFLFEHPRSIHAPRLQSIQP